MATDPNLLMHLVNAPGLAGQAVFAGQNNALEQAQARQGIQFNTLKMDALRQQQKQEQDREAATIAYFANPSSQALSNLMARYPEQAEAYRKAWSVKDTAQRTADMGQLGAIVSAIDNKRPDLVTNLLRQRRDAEKARGMDTSDVDHALEGVAKNDESALKTLKGFALAQLAAADPEKFAENFKAAGGDRGTKVVSAGGALVDEQGNELYKAPFAPRPVTVGEGDTVVEYQPQPGGGDPASGGDVAERMLDITPFAESGNREFNADGSRVTSPKGARGVMQVMPKTATDPGYGIKPSNGTPEDDARLGRQYLTKMLSIYGNPAQAWAAYNAGPGAVDKAIQSGGDKWLSRMPKETRDYVARNMVALNRGQDSQAGGARVIAQGAPKRGYQMLSPEEARGLGLDPNIKYQRSPDGQITTLGGQTKAQLRPWPAVALNARVDNDASIKNIDNALALLDPKNTTAEAKAAREAVGFGTGGFGIWDPNRTNPEGAAFRGLIGQISGTIIKEISGAAVSVSEDDRLKKWVPLVTDSPATISAKLSNLRREIAQRNTAMESIYSQDQGYRPLQQEPQAPIRVRTIQEAQKLKPGTIYIAPDGKKRRR